MENLRDAEESNNVEKKVSYRGSAIDERIVRAVEEMGFETMTPIQEQAIPIMLEGKDLIGQAQTGTGKTAAFGIPLIQGVDPQDKSLQAIVRPHLCSFDGVAAHMVHNAPWRPYHNLRPSGQTPYLSGNIPILEITKEYQKPDAQYLKMMPKEVTISLVKQVYYQVSRKDKEEVLTRLLDM